MATELDPDNLTFFKFLKLTPAKAMTGKFQFNFFNLNFIGPSIWVILNLGL